MLLQPHHQRVDPGVEQNISALEPHHRRIARGEILNVDRRRNHRARNAEALGDVALHLGAEHEFGVGGGNRLLDREIVVGDEWFDAVQLGRVAQVAREFTVIAAKPDDLEPHLLARDARRSDRVACVAEDEDALGGQVRRVDRPRIPWQP